MCNHSYITKFFLFKNVFSHLYWYVIDHNVKYKYSSCCVDAVNSAAAEACRGFCAAALLVCITVINFRRRHQTGCWQ